MKRMIVGLMFLSLALGSNVMSSNAADNATFPVKFSFYDQDSYAPSTPTEEDGSPKGVKQISEGKATIYNDGGEILSEFNLDGSSKTIDMDGGNEYTIEIDFNDDSPYFDLTVDAYIPEDPDFTTSYIPYPIYVKARHILPQALDAQDGTVLNDCIFRLTSQETGETWNITTDWTEGDISMLPVLKPGGYGVSALKIPTGYYFEGGQEVVLEMDADVSTYKTYVQFRIGRQTGILYLEAKDTNGQPIKGVTFQVMNDSTGKSYDPVTSDDEGKASIWDIPLGTYKEGKLSEYDNYSIKIVDLPKDYKANDQKQTKITFENAKDSEGTFLSETIGFFFQKENAEDTEGSGTDTDSSESNVTISDNNSKDKTSNNMQNGNKEDDAAKTGDVTNFLLVLTALESSLLVLIKRKEVL